MDLGINTTAESGTTSSSWYHAVHGLPLDIGLFCFRRLTDRGVDRWRRRSKPAGELCHRTASRPCSQPPAGSDIRLPAQKGEGAGKSPLLPLAASLYGLDQSLYLATAPTAESGGVQKIIASTAADGE